MEEMEIASLIIQISSAPPHLRSQKRLPVKDGDGHKYFYSDLYLHTNVCMFIKLGSCRKLPLVS